VTKPEDDWDETGLEDRKSREEERALRRFFEETEIGVASHQVDVFVLDPGTDGYIGRLCRFNRCPKGKRECLVAGCGAAKFLKQHEAFQWRPQSLAEDRIVHLFGRASGRPCASNVTEVE
jgi:hypothetical protein